MLVFAASRWETAIKSSAEKLEAGPLVGDFCGELEQAGLVELPVAVAHAVRAGLPGKSLWDPSTECSSPRHRRMLYPSSAGRNGLTSARFGGLGSGSTLEVGSGRTSGHIC